jgi:hypothetical protein
MQATQVGSACSFNRSARYERSADHRPILSQAPISADIAQVQRPVGRTLESCCARTFAAADRARDGAAACAPAGTRVCCPQLAGGWAGTEAPPCSPRRYGPHDNRYGLRATAPLTLTSQGCGRGPTAGSGCHSEMTSSPGGTSSSPLKAMSANREWSLTVTFMPPVV